MKLLLIALILNIAKSHTYKISDEENTSGVIETKNRTILIEFETTQHDQKRIILFPRFENEQSAMKNARCTPQSAIFEARVNTKLNKRACSIKSIESKLVFDLPLNLKMGSNGLLGSLTYVYITQTDDQSKFLSCDVTFGQIRRSDQSKTVEWYNCPAGCTTLNQFEVIGKENGFYSIHSSICRSAIHKGIISDNGGLVKVNAIVSPVDIKSSQFKAMTSNSIRSVVKSVLDGNSHVALDRNSPCFAIESISNQKPCPGSNEIKFEKSQIRASSFLETYTENYDDGNALYPVSTFLNWVPYQAISSSASPWSPALNDTNPWLEIDFQGQDHHVTKIITASSDIQMFQFKIATFTAKYRMATSNEWIDILDIDDNQKIFDASGQPSSHDFVEPLRASVIRIYPKAAPGSPVSALKLRAFGCQAMDSELYSHQSKDSEQSVIFIGIIVGLSFVAVLLASISLILIKKSKNKKSHLTHFEKSNSFQANIYTQNTFCKDTYNQRSIFQGYNREAVYSTPIVITPRVHDARDPNTINCVNPGHEYSTIETLPLRNNQQEIINLTQKHLHNYSITSYDDHTYSTIG